MVYVLITKEPMHSWMLHFQIKVLLKILNLLCQTTILTHFAAISTGDLQVFLERFTLQGKNITTLQMLAALLYLLRFLCLLTNIL